VPCEIGTREVVVRMELAGQLSTVEWQLVMTMVWVEYAVSSRVEGAGVVAMGAAVVAGVVGTSGALLGLTDAPGTVVGA